MILRCFHNKLLVILDTIILKFPTGGPIFLLKKY